MKVTQQMEWEYDKQKNIENQNFFMTKDTIKDFVAVDFLIPIVEELYNKNIFTSWSGLTGDVHIRIPLDGLSKENYRIAQENCIANSNWRLVKPPYDDEKDIVQNCAFEIYVNYEDGITEVSEVVDRLLKEIAKLTFQDVQIAKAEYARESKLPRVTLEGLYKRSETTIFDMQTQQEKIVPAESFEELSEMFLEGDTPEYFYDEETDTYFRNSELIEKSKEYRNPEKRKEKIVKEIQQRLNDKMSNEEKYRVIFDWMTEYFKYDYSTLYSTQAINIAAEAYSKYGNIIRQTRSKIENFMNLDDIEKSRALLKQLYLEKKYPELISLKQKEISFREKKNYFVEHEKSYEYGNMYITKYGVCENFAKEFKDICNKLGLQCEVVRGHILSDGVECGHAWNAIMIDGKLRHVDISSAIHCKDGTNLENKPEDFFAKTFDELKEIDNGKQRKISPDSNQTLRTFISNSVGLDVTD